MGTKLTRRRRAEIELKEQIKSLESALAQSQKEAGDQALKLQAYQRAVEEVMKEKYDNVNIPDKVWWNAMVDRFHFIIRKHLEAIQ